MAIAQAARVARWSRWIAIGLIVAPLCAPAAEAVVSTTPYAALYNVLRPAAAIGEYSRLIAIERIESKLPDVRAPDIRITIRAGSGAIAVPVGSDGNVDFPRGDALYAENPMVETNQPKGSLALTVSVGLRIPSTLQVAWSELAEGLAQADALHAKASGGAPAATTRGIEVYFDAGAPASIILAGKSEYLLQADAAGRIVLLRDRIVESEQPQVRFSRTPSRMLPYMGDRESLR
jgi:hypothetical protein